MKLDLGDNGELIQQVDKKAEVAIDGNQMNSDDVMKKDEDDTRKILKRVPKFVSVAELLGSTVEMAMTETANVSLTMMSLKSQLHRGMLGMHSGSLKRASVSLLESLASLALEDHLLTGQWENCLGYLDCGLAALQALPETSCGLSLEQLATAKDSVRVRRCNMSNLMDSGDKRNNFLNRLDQVDQAIRLLREILLLKLVRGPVKAGGSGGANLPKAKPAVERQLTDTEEDDSEVDEEEFYEDDEINQMAMQMMLSARLGPPGLMRSGFI